MYSVVLLMAVTTGSESADFGGRRACRGCSGCYVACGCYSTCAVRVRGCRRARCHSCYVTTCHAYAGCYSGCYAAPVSYGCHAAAPVCHGGVVYGGVVHGGVVTGGYVMGQPIISGQVVLGGGTTSGDREGTATAEDDRLKPGSPLTAEERRWLKEMLDAEKDAAERQKIEDEFTKDSRVGRKATYEVFKKMKESKDEVGTKATIVVVVPADARVTIDGMSTMSTSNLRWFESPTLNPGKTYSYTFQAEYRDNGAPVTVSKKVLFQAGKVVRLDLTNNGTAVASK